MNTKNTLLNSFWKVFGPIVLSACSIFTTFQIIKFITGLVEPNLDLLSSRGGGKIIFSAMAILQVFLFISIQSKEFIKKFLNTNIFYFAQKRFLSTISKYFLTFFFLHWLVLFALLAIGQVSYNPAWGVLSWKLIPNILWGVLVTFFLAWSEELIFRGLIYPYFSSFWPTLPSLLLTSFCFMLVHDLTNPINMITIYWKIGLGLFLLGVLLNTIYVITGKLYTGMGVHMGLVSVKVILRRMPFLTFIDLRQSHTAHLLFVATIIFLIVLHKEKFFSPARQPKLVTQ